MARAKERASASPSPPCLLIRRNSHCGALSPASPRPSTTPRTRRRPKGSQHGTDGDLAPCLWRQVVEQASLQAAQSRSSGATSHVGVCRRPGRHRSPFRRWRRAAALPGLRRPSHSSPAARRRRRPCRALPGEVVILRPKCRRPPSSRRWDGRQIQVADVEAGRRSKCCATRSSMVRTGTRSVPSTPPSRLRGEPRRWRWPPAPRTARPDRRPPRSLATYRAA